MIIDQIYLNLLRRVSDCNVLAFIRGYLFQLKARDTPFCLRSTESSPETLLLCENGLMHCTPELRERETYRWARSHSLFEGVIHLNVLWVSGIGTRSENWEATARKKRDRGRKSALVLSSSSSSSRSSYLHPAEIRVRLAILWPPEGYGDMLSWGIIYRSRPVKPQKAFLIKACD